MPVYTYSSDSRELLDAFWVSVGHETELAKLHCADCSEARYRYQRFEQVRNSISKLSRLVSLSLPNLTLGRYSWSEVLEQLSCQESLQHLNLFGDRVAASSDVFWDPASLTIGPLLLEFTALQSLDMSNVF